MLLKNNFYKLVSQQTEEDQLLFTIQLNANHSIFDGHFPGNPVTPGVVQLEIIKELLAEHFGKFPQLIQLLNAKYLAILNPVQSKEVQIKMTLKLQEDGHYRVSGQFFSQTEIFMKFSGIYQL